MAKNFRAILIGLIQEMTIGAEFTFEMIYDQCAKVDPDFPKATLRKLLNILHHLGTLSSWRATNAKYHIYKKDYDVTWSQFMDRVHMLNIQHYNTYKKPLKDSAKVAKLIKKKVGDIPVDGVENPDEMVGIKRGVLEGIKKTMVAQDATILEYEKTSAAYVQNEKQLRATVNLLQQEVAALKKCNSEKLDELASLTRELRRREAVAKQTVLTPADVSFFERRGRAV